MRISKIQITAFGKLKNFELSVCDSFNVIYGDNEAGKSTIMAFIKMALYGSTVRGSSTDNPRVKYAPFDGSAMSGILYFSHDRVNYRLECKFGATPAKDKIVLFNNDTESVITLGASQTVGSFFFNLTGETFESTAFIQSVIPSGSSDEIVKRLSAVGGGGDVSPETVKRRLTAAKESQFTKRKVGAGDRLREKIDKTKLQLEQEKERAKILNAAKENALQKSEQISALTEKKQKLSAFIACAADLRRRDQLKEYIFAFNKMQSAKTECKGVDREFYNNCSKQLWSCNEQRSKYDRAASDAALAMAQHGFTQKEQAQNHKNSCAQLAQNAKILPQTATKSKDTRTAFIIAGAVLLLLGIVAGNFIKFGYVGCIIGALLLLFGFLKKSAQKTQPTEQELIAIRKNAEQELAEAIHLCELIEQSEALLADCNACVNTLLADVKKFEPEVTEQSISKVLEDMDKKLCALQDATTCYVTLSNALGVTPEQAEQELAALPDTDISPKQIAMAQNELRIVEHTLTELHKSAAALSERINLSGGEARQGAAELERDILNMQAELSNREAFAAAADLANSVLADAYSELSQTFGPKVNQKTAELFAKLTDDKYSEVKVATDLSLKASEHGSFELIESAYLSAGTADQAYIALRLAIVQLLGNGKLPVFLDDAFLQFDEKREQAALTATAELAKNEQILLFTCREKTAQNAQNAGAKIIKL